MSQSRRMSLIETVASIAIGFVVSLVLTALVLPAHGFEVTFAQNLQITAAFTVACPRFRGHFCTKPANNGRIHRGQHRQGLPGASRF